MSRLLMETKEIFKKNNLIPKKSLGQNFLIDEKALKKIVETIQIKPSDIIIEVGPGIGTLTKELAKKAKKVIAVEKDENLTKILKEILKKEGIKNVEIIGKDIFEIFNSQSLIFDKFSILNYKVTGNLPFYLTAPLIRSFLEFKNPPKEMVLTIQKEVAQRICEKPPKMNLLATSVQLYARPKIIGYISKNSFWPQPKVDGAILQISKIATNLLQINKNLFFRIVKAGFSQPRKTLLNNLAKNLNFDKKEIERLLLNSNIKPNQRAETLNVQDWLNLTKTFKEK